MDASYSTRYVTKHLGVARKTLIGWVNTPSAAFPMPVVHLMHDEKGSAEDFGWSASQLPLLRDWLAARLGISDPAAHWAVIDSGATPPGGHLDQAPLWEE